MRNVRVINKRLKIFRKRIERYRKLKKCGVDTARIVRTGGGKSLTYGQYASGTSPSLLLMQRRAVAQATAPASGTAGQNLDLALMIADGSATGKADPAYDAHLDPIVHWAQAVWFTWLSIATLNLMITDAVDRLTNAARTWAVVTGPASALVASAGRLQWTVQDASTLRTDRGRVLALHRDPPAVVAKEVCEAVRRWRWARIETAIPSLSSGGEGRGAAMGAIWKILAGKPKIGWSPELRGALKSAITGRQWAQARCFQAGLVPHSKCICCVAGATIDSSEGAPLHDRGDDSNRSSNQDVLMLSRTISSCSPFSASPTIPVVPLQTAPVVVDERNGVPTSTSRPSCAFDDPDGLNEEEDFVDDHRESFDEPPNPVDWMVDEASSSSWGTGGGAINVRVDLGIEHAPVGTLTHRIWTCARLRIRRQKLVPPQLRHHLLQEPAPGDAALERALFPALTHLIPPPTVEATFKWVKEPTGGTIPMGSTAYSDGSMFDGSRMETARCGWSFAAILPGKGIVASANGVPPDWIHDNAGAESWALLQAALVAEPGVAFRVDCKPTVQAVHMGAKEATNAKRLLARVNGMLHAALDDVDNELVVWMPSHKSANDIGRLRLGNGDLMTEMDRIGNNAADALAKEAALTHKVPKEIIDALDAQEKLVADTAKLIATMTWVANHQTDEPCRDTDASRIAAVQAAARRGETNSTKPKKGKWKKVVELRPPSLGGHNLMRGGLGWRCTNCKKQSRAWEKMAPSTCEGSSARKWDARARKLVEQHGSLGVGHVRVFSGDIVWCTKCGAYADNIAKGLARPCGGQPRVHSIRCLKALKRGKHPRTGAELGKPQYEITNCKISAVAPMQVTGASVLEKRKRDNATTGPTAAERREALLQRIRAKEAATVCMRRRISRKRKLSSAEELIFQSAECRRRYAG